MSMQQSTILIVDDLREVRDVMEHLLFHPDYQMIFASSGHEALKMATEQHPDIILLDVMMPEMDGFEVCRRLRANPTTADVPIVIVTALNDERACLMGLEAGADDVIAKPFNMAELRARVRTITRLNRYRRLHDEHVRFEQLFRLAPDAIAVVDRYEEIMIANPAMAQILGSAHPNDLRGINFLELMSLEQRERFRAILDAAVVNLMYAQRLETALIGNGTLLPVELHIGHIVWEGRQAAQIIARDIGERKAAEGQIRLLHDELLTAYDATLAGWVHAMDLRDKETEGHSQRVTSLTVELAVRMGLSGETLQNIWRGALLHDVGKLAIPDSVLLKPGPLTEDEWVVMRKHPVYAYEWLSQIEYLRPALDIPYSHHERWDGSGYPRGLKEEQIPLAARLFAVVDVWDALTNDRPYRSAWSAERTSTYLHSLMGVHFDPQVVEAFLTMQEETQKPGTERQEPRITHYSGKRNG